LHFLPISGAIRLIGFACAGARRFEITLGQIHGGRVAEQTSRLVAGYCASIAWNIFFVRSSQSIERLVVLKSWL